MEAKTISDFLFFSEEGIPLLFRCAPVLLLRNCLKAYTNAIIKSSKNGKKILYRTGRISIAFYLTKFIVAISEHVISYFAGACRSLLVSIDKPADHGRIAAVLQVVEACFGIVIVSTVPQGVDVRQAATGGNEFAPGVVLVGSQINYIDSFPKIPAQ